MNIHEYQAKALLAVYGVPTPRGTAVDSVESAMAAIESIPGPPWMVKAQIHAGGRGKGGGVRVCGSADEVGKAARDILGMRLVTHQTGRDGRVVKKLLVEQGTRIARELYLAVVVDRANDCLTVMASPSGGMDIETVTRESPEKLFAARLGGDHRMWAFQARHILYGCGLEPDQVRQGTTLVSRLVRLCVDTDATLAEINPLAVDADGCLVALDAKLNFDESALFRHPDIAALADPDESDPLELRAAELGVNYIRLGGAIGTMVNGAGLAMATMDAIKLAGGEPANFLDAGGGAGVEQVRRGFGIMLSDPGVRGILVNIFGGILRCDIVAQGVVEAARDVGLRLPLVVRMEGTNVGAARRIIKESGLSVHTAAGMADAARMIVGLTKEGGE